MNPLVVIVTYGRPSETFRTLDALSATTSLKHDIELVIMDNGSDEAMRAKLREWWRMHEPYGWLCALDANIGCPRALNLALSGRRKPGQPVVKMDNDVEMLTPNWAGIVGQFIESYNKDHAAKGKPLAMVGAFYNGILGYDGKNGRLRRTEPARFSYLGRSFLDVAYHISPIIGHTVWHTGAFMDAVGYFDVLAPDHLYGFEDLILSHKADMMGWGMVVLDGWQIRNIQRHSALGDGTKAHVEKFRPLYNERIKAIGQGGSLRTGPDGKPETEEKV